MMEIKTTASTRISTLPRSRCLPLLPPLFLFLVIVIVVVVVSAPESSWAASNWCTMDTTYTQVSKSREMEKGRPSRYASVAPGYILSMYARCPPDDTVFAPFSGPRNL